MKNLLIYVLLGVCIVLGYQVFSTNRALKKGQIEAQVPKTPISIKAEEIAREVDKEGREHVVYKEAEPILKLIEVRVEDKAKVDSALNLIGIKEKQLKQYQRLAGTVSQENIALKRMINEITKDTAFIYRDKWLDLSFQKHSDTLALGSFLYNFDFESLNYWDKKWFLGTKHSYIDIWSKDPRVKIRGYDRLTIKQDQPRYGLRIQANAQYDISTGKINYGPGVRVDAGRFSFQGLYSYFPEKEEWRPIISSNFDLVRF